MTSSERRAVVLFGPPGSGKGTQGRAIGELPRFVHYDLGERLRGIEAGTELGQAVRSTTTAGRPLPDELVLEIFDEDLERLAEEAEYRPEEHVLLLDGLPRTSGQVEGLSTRCDLLGVIELAVQDVTELFGRLQERGLENGRVDDVSESVIEARIRRYEKDSLATLNRFERESLHRIDAGRSPLEVLGDVVQALLGLLDTSRPLVRHKPESKEPKGNEWRTIR